MIPCSRCGLRRTGAVVAVALSLGARLDISAQPTTVASPEPFVSSVPAAPFVDGDRVLFLGDSITHNGFYLYYIEHFYATRFPDREITFRNAGVSGGKAPDTERRLAWDVAAWHPTHVVLNLGMNDVGTSHYTDATPEVRDATTEQMVVRYEETMARILDELADMPTTVTLLVPTPYDQTGSHERLNALGKNDAIRRLGTWLEGEADRRRIALVDLNTPLLAINARLQSTDPSATAISPDRVHPGKAGHLIMAAEILRAQGLDTGNGWSIRLDFPSGKVLDRAGAGAHVHQAYGGAFAWGMVGPMSLPWVLDDAAEGTPAQSALDGAAWLPTFASLTGNMTLALENLPPGTWKVRLVDGPEDEASVAPRADAATWAHGIDLGAGSQTQWHHSSRQLLNLILEKRDEERKLRSVAWVRSRVFDPRGTNVADLAACDVAIAEWKAGEDYRPTNDRYVEEYLKHRDPATMAAIEARIAELDARIDNWPPPQLATLFLVAAKE